MSDDIILEDVELDLLADKETLAEEIKNLSNYFTIEEGVTYKVELLTTKVKRTEDTFEEEDGSKKKVMKYIFQIKAKGSDKSQFEGTWKIGVSIYPYIFKEYEKGAVFNVSKTGTGKKTKYSINKDF